VALSCADVDIGDRYIGQLGFIRVHDGKRDVERKEYQKLAFKADNLVLFFSLTVETWAMLSRVS